MASWLAVVVLCLLEVRVTTVSAVAPKYHSCAELYSSNVARASAEYTIYNHHNKPFQVYCEFHHGYGYTFISPATNVSIDVDDLHTETDHVIIRNIHDDDKQYEVKLEQITKYKNQPLSIQYNSNFGYSGIQNARMTPYIFIGLIPSSMQHIHNVEGYRINGQDITYTNCGIITKSYFAFLFNHNHVSVTNYLPVDTTMIHQWADRAMPVDPAHYLPDSFYSLFEVNQGGCGGYGFTVDFPDVTGAAVGLRYDITCPAPPSIAHSTHHATGTSRGSTVTYTCDHGYHITSGSPALACTETGIWLGIAPVCGHGVCDSRPCYHGGTCTAKGDSYVCSCQPGTYGKRCETEIGKRREAGI